MFLQRVYKEWRALFWLLLVFFGLQLFFMAKGIENAPFFLYNMFSFAHQPKDSFPVLLIKKPGGYISPFNYSNREAELLTNNVAYYQQFKKANYQDNLNETIERRFKSRMSPSLYQFAINGLSNDSSGTSQYPFWWGKYFTTISNEKYDSILLVTSYVSFQPEFSKSPVDSVIFTAHFK